MPFGKGKKNPVAGMLNTRILDLILEYQKEFIDEIIVIVPEVIELYLETLTDEELMAHELDISDLEKLVAASLGKQLALNRLTANRLFYGIGTASAEAIKLSKKFKKDAKNNLKEKNKKAK